MSKPRFVGVSVPDVCFFHSSMALAADIWLMGLEVGHPPYKKAAYDYVGPVGWTGRRERECVQARVAHAGGRFDSR
jgi:hypothetical protein